MGFISSTFNIINSQFITDSGINISFSNVIISESTIVGSCRGGESFISIANSRFLKPPDVDVIRVEAKGSGALFEHCYVEGDLLLRTPRGGAPMDIHDNEILGSLITEDFRGEFYDNSVKGISHIRAISANIHDCRFESPVEIWSEETVYFRNCEIRISIDYSTYYTFRGNPRNESQPRNTIENCLISGGIRFFREIADVLMRNNTIITDLTRTGISIHTVYIQNSFEFTNNIVISIPDEVDIFYPTPGQMEILVERSVNNISFMQPRFHPFYSAI